MKNKKIWFAILAIVVIILIFVLVRGVNKQENSNENEEIDSSNTIELKVERDENVDINNIKENMQKNANNIMEQGNISR